MSAALMVLVIAAVPAFGQQVPEFVTAVPPDADSAASGSSSYVQNTATVNISLDALEAPKMNLSVLGEVLEITHKMTIERGPADFTYIGSTPGDDENVFIAVLGEEARLEIDGISNSYIMAPKADSTHEIRKFDPLGFDSDNEKPEEITLNPNYQNIIRNMPDGEFSRDSYHSLPIDVFAIHTMNATNADSAMVYGSPGHVRLIYTLAIDRMNSAMRFADIPLVLNLVGRTSDHLYTESGKLRTDLDRLIKENDGNFEPELAQMKREEADIGILFVNSDIPECGLASSFLPNPDEAFIIINIGCQIKRVYLDQDEFLGPRGEKNISLTMIVMHEIGHLFGARHERADDPAIVPFPYGHGYEADDRHSDKKITTIMGMPCETCVWDTIWSDGDKNFPQTLTPAGTARHEDNARVVTRAGPYIASLAGAPLEYTLKTDLNPIINAPDDIRAYA